MIGLRNRARMILVLAQKSQCSLSFYVEPTECLDRVRWLHDIGCSSIQLKPSDSDVCSWFYSNGSNYRDEV